MSCMKEEKLISPEVERLEKHLKNLRTPSLDEAQKIRIKNSLISKINLADVAEYGSLIAYVHKLVSQIVFGASRRASIKESIFERIESIQQRSFVWQRVFVFSQKFVSVMSVFIMVLGIFSVFNLRTTIVRAGTFTKLEAFTTDVYVEREGDQLLPFNGMILHEGDRIITGNDGFAVIRYFDDSITRLANNTELVIDKLFKPEDTQAVSYIEVSLNNGVLWSRVMNLVGKDSSFVVKADDIYASAKKAAFNVELNEGKLEVEVYSNIVDVRPEGGEKSEKVISGNKATFEQQNINVTKLDDEEKDIAWVQENLSNDKKDIQVTEERILAAKKESIGVDNPNNINFGTSLSEKTLILFTFDDIKKKKIELDLAEKNFLAAEIKLKSSNLSEKDGQEIEKVINDFSSKVQDFYKISGQVQGADEEYSTELKSYLDDKLLTLKKDLSVSTDEQSLKLKGVIDNLMVYGAQNPEEAADIKLDQTFDQLADATEVAASGDEQSASDMIQQSNQTVTEVVEIIKEIDNTKIDEKAELAQKASEYIDVVETIDVPKGEGVTELKEKVSSMEQDVKTVEDASIVGEKDGTSDSVISPLPAEQPYGVDVSGGKPLPPGL